VPELRSNTQLGPYTITQILPSGKGGMARVYQADWRRDSRTETVSVAIKFANTADDKPSGSNTSARMTPEEYEAFCSDALHNEVDILRQLRHPGLVRLYPIPWREGMRRDPYVVRATGLAREPWFCVMEYLGGGSLNQLLKHRDRLEPRMAVEIAYQIAAALDYMHAKGFFHLDVKPNNILFREPFDPAVSPEAVLIDFGIAKRRRQSDVEAGTLEYSPPERVAVITGEEPPEKAGQNPPVDVYAVGVLLYRMLAGRLPFSGHSRSSLASAILRSDPAPVRQFAPEIVPELDSLVRRTLSKKPEDRPTAHDLVLKLDEAMAPPRFLTVDGPPKHSAHAFTAGWRGFSGWMAATIILGGLSLAQVGVLLGVAPNPFAPPIPTATLTVTRTPPATPTPTSIVATSTMPPTAIASPTEISTATSESAPPTEAPTQVTAQPPTRTPVPTRTATPTLRPTPVPTPAPATSTPTPGG